MKFIAIIIGIILISGCSPVTSKHRPISYYQEQPTETTSAPLSFSINDEEFSDAEIQKILSYRLALPAKNRVAILNLTNNDYWRHYSSDFIQLDNEAITGFISNLNESSRIYDASFLPSMLIPQRISLAQLRAAAARYQADLLLTYQSSCQSFEKFKFIDPNVTKAYCTVETILIDTRSGIVAFTAVATNEFTAKKEEQDINFTETRKKAEMKAISAGLSEVSTELRAFIEAMPSL